MFSMTTIESSMTRPMAMVRPPSVSMLRELPRLQRMISAPTTLSGIESPAMTVERQLRRNTQMTMIAKTAPMMPSLQQRSDAVLDEDRLVDDRGDRRLAAEVLLDRGQLGGDRVGDVDGVAAARLADGDADRGLAVGPGDRRQGRGGDLDRGDVAERDRRRRGGGGAARRRGGHRVAAAEAAAAEAAPATAAAAAVAADGSTRSSIAFSVSALALTVMG